MPLTSADQELVAAMKQRELHIKRRQRAADAISYQLRRHRVVLLAVVALVVGAVVSGVFLTAVGSLPGTASWWRATVVVAVVGVVLGAYVGRGLLGTSRGRRHLAATEGRIREKYSGDLHAGRRWLQFYYQGEDISPYVPQILHFLESERRFDSVDDALAFARANHSAGASLAARSLARFNSVVAQTNLVVISSTDESGHPSSRIMRFVRSKQPGVWLITTAAEGSKVRQLDRGRIALVTVPTEGGATISSNRVRIRRLGVLGPDTAALFRAQVPGYLAGMTVPELEQELVFELTLQSARVDSWVDQDIVDFSGAQDPAQ